MLAFFLYNSNIDVMNRRAYVFCDCSMHGKCGTSFTFTLYRVAPLSYIDGDIPIAVSGAQNHACSLAAS